MAARAMRTSRVDGRVAATAVTLLAPDMLVLTRATRVLSPDTRVAIADMRPAAADARALVVSRHLVT
jgi:hypothetical protein